MSYTSRLQSASSKSDCVYDSDYITIDKKADKKSLSKAKRSAAAVKLYPRHEIMFSKERELERFAFRKELHDLPKAPRRISPKYGSSDSFESHFNHTSISTRLKAGANELTERQVTNVVMRANECKSKPLGQYRFKSNTKVNVIEMKLSHSAIKEGSPVHRYTYCQYSQERKGNKFKTRGTQSLYRESSAQTLPYLPEVSNKENELEQIELFKLPTILSGDGPPGLYQVEMLERSRKRWTFAKALKENLRRQIEEIKEKAKLSEQSVILHAFEWEHWIEREEYIQECQMLRLEILIGMFNKREEKMHITSKARIERSYEQILARRDATLNQNQVKYEREMRQLEIKRRRVPKCWRKENILSQLGSPSSEFYGPQLRYGVNPSRRHFVGGRKEFEARMDDLEKRAVKFTKLVCPFAKLKKWAQPKQRLLEIEQNFCSDENLQKMYETLTSLRKQAVKQKLVPKCLIQKTKPKAMKDEVIKPHIKEPIVIEAEEIQEFAEEEPNEEERKREENMKFRKSIAEKNKRAQYLLQELYNEDLEAMVQEYEGFTIGWLMRFLSEEMGRLQEQRLLHYITMLAQKERWRREAAEAGLRQKENDMRQIYEQLYSESYIAGGESCRNYLNMILGNDIRNIAHDKAEAEVLGMARVIDADIQRWLDSFYGIQNPLNYDSLRYNLKKIIFPDLNEILKELETKQTMQYIIEMLFDNVFTLLEPYDIGTFTANELVDRLFDLDLYYFSSEENSTCSCLACECPDDEREIRAVIRKLIRQAVPGRRWKMPVERLANDTVKDLIDGVFNIALGRGSVFESESMERFCRLRKSPSHLNLFSPSIPHYFDLSSSESFRELEDILSIVKSDFQKIRDEPIKDKSGESSVSASQSMPQSFLFESSEDGHFENVKAEEGEKDKDKKKLSAKFLNHIYRELLNFLGSAEESESFEEEERSSTSRSVQSESSDGCGLRLIMDEVFNKLSMLEETNKDIETESHPSSSIHSLMSEILEPPARAPHILTDDEIAEIYQKSGPLELIVETSNEISSKQSEDEQIEQRFSKKYLIEEAHHMGQEMQATPPQNINASDATQIQGIEIAMTPEAVAVPESLPVVEEQNIITLELVAEPEEAQLENTSRKPSQTRIDNAKKMSLMDRDSRHSGISRVRISEKEEKIQFTTEDEAPVERRVNSSLKSVQINEEATSVEPEREEEP